MALDLATNPHDFLSTVQVGITMIGTMAGAFGGATVAGEFAVYLKRFEAVAPYAETVSITLVVLAISYLTLILGELLVILFKRARRAIIASMRTSMVR